METKVCTTCKMEKSLNDFCKDKYNKDGMDNECRACNKLYRIRNTKNIKKSSKKYHDNNKDKTHEYYLKNKSKLSKKAKIYYKINREKLIKRAEEYRGINSDKIKKWKAEWYIKNRDKIEKKAKEYRLLNRDKTNKAKRESYNDDRNNRLKLATEYRITNREKIRKWGREYWYKRKEDPMIRLRVNISSSMRISLQGNKNGYKWEKLVGYKLKDLKTHLESQFRDGMTWDNYGRKGWNIDHKIPVSIFNIDGVKSRGFKACWALGNLQPLWEKENQIKNNKLFQ